jgi:hypothetical protein
MNNFILGSKGFLKSVSFDKVKRETVIEWTVVLREAQRFNTKGAKSLIERNGLDASVWKPYKEEPVRGKWKVIQVTDSWDDNNKSSEWRPVKVSMKCDSDVNYLVTKGKSDGIVYYDSHREALRVSKEKNLAIIKDLELKMREMAKELMFK